MCSPELIGRPSSISISSLGCRNQAFQLLWINSTIRLPIEARKRPTVAIWILHKAALNAAGWSVLAVGLLVASVSALAAIWLLIHILERFSEWPFVLYRIVLGTRFTPSCLLPD